MDHIWWAPISLKNSPGLKLISILIQIINNYLLACLYLSSNFLRHTVWWQRYSKIEIQYYCRRKDVNLYTRVSANVAVWEVFSELPVRRNRLSLKKDQVSSAATIRKVTLTLSKLRTNRHTHNHNTAKFSCSCDILGNRKVWCWHIVYVCLHKYFSNA